MGTKEKKDLKENNYIILGSKSGVWTTICTSTTAYRQLFQVKGMLSTKKYIYFHLKVSGKSCFVNYTVCALKTVLKKPFSLHQL